MEEDEGLDYDERFEHQHRSDVEFAPGWDVRVAQRCQKGKVYRQWTSPTIALPGDTAVNKRLEG